MMATTFSCAIGFQLPIPVSRLMRAMLRRVFDVPVRIPSGSAFNCAMGCILHCLFFATLRCQSECLMEFLFGHLLTRPVAARARPGAVCQCRLLGDGDFDGVGPGLALPGVELAAVVLHPAELDPELKGGDVILDEDSDQP